MLPIARSALTFASVALVTVGCAAAETDAADDDASAESEGALVQAACPSGTTLVKTIAGCGARGAQAPASLTESSSRASVGHVIRPAGFDEPSAPCLPALVCRDDSAPTLLFSDSPEMPDKDGILYAASIGAGKFRAYVYHANGGRTPRRFPVALYNPGATDARVTITKRGVVPPSKEYAAIGRDVAAKHMASELRAPLVVPAGKRVLLDEGLARLVADRDELVQAMIDFETPAPLKITFASLSGDARADVVPLDLPVLARDRHDRGTFERAGFVIVAPAAAGDRGVRRLRLGTGDVEPLAQGVDALTGQKLGLGGNYGVTYDVRIGMPRAGTIGLSPRGGEWAGGLRLEAPGARAVSMAVPAGAEPLSDPRSAVSMGPITAGDVRLVFVTGGGSNTPLDLFVSR